jgi:SAM-dependent methyltransferase
MGWTNTVVALSSIVYLSLDRNGEGLLVRSSFSCSKPLSRADAASLIDTTLLPLSAFGTRLSVSGFQGTSEGAFSGRDESLELGYGEFPYASFDTLVDAALNYVENTNNNKITLLDLGSGAGRLCLYSVLTRPSWQIAGVEIVKSLHDLSLEASHAAVERKLLNSGSNLNSDNPSSTSFLEFFFGDAQQYSDILRQADIVFCYSTAWRHSGFSTRTNSLVLSKEWNEILRHCKVGAIVITTDRTCDPAYGWTHLHSMEVENREVMGSVGYVQRLDSSIEIGLVCRYHG